MVTVSNMPAIEDVCRSEGMIGTFVHISNNDERDLVDEVAEWGKKELIVDNVEEARGEDGCGLVGVFVG